MYKASFKRLFFLNFEKLREIEENLTNFKETQFDKTTQLYLLDKSLEKVKLSDYTRKCQILNFVT